MSATRLVKIGPENGGNFEYAWEGSYLRAHILSDIGKRRTHNEDSCMLSVPGNGSLASGESALFAVADGMGGASAGECASRLALETVAGSFRPHAGSSTPLSLRESVENANAKIFEEASINPEFHGMGTTASVVLISGCYAYVAQVGDSRVYLARGKGPVAQITDDHSVVAEQVRNGLLSEEEARTHSLKNLITRAVGIRQNVKTDLFAARLMRGDTLLICSDGLNNMVEDKQIADSLQLDNLQGAARQLVGRALAQGGTDNVTCVLIRVIANPPKTTIEEGAVEVELPPVTFIERLRQRLH